MASFNSKLSLDQVKISTDSISALTADESKLDAALQILSTFGFLIISNAPGKEVTNDAIKKNVLDLKPLFGKPTFHIRADKDGVAPIFNDKTEKLIMFKNDEFEPHTDGTFSVEKDEFLTLTCYTPAIDGGESYVVSGTAIYEYAKKVLKPYELDALFRSDAVTYKRPPQITKKAIFTKDEITGNITMVWRKDLFVDNMDEVVHPDAHAGVRAIIDFVNDEQNHVVYKLKRNETLLCNNGAVLHARKSYPDDQERHLDRINFHTVGSGAKLDGRVQPGFKIQFDSTLHYGKKYYNSIEKKYTTSATNTNYIHRSSSISQAA